MSNTLFMRLEGPFQSWGERARWSVRDTSTEPTKSGVVGLLGCALGITSDIELRDLSRSIQIGVRCDRQGTYLVDFHTIVGGVMTAEGKLTDNTVLSTRAYLCDASFLVAVKSTDKQIEKLAIALQHPFWPYYLGRKSCVPSLPVYEGVGDFEDLECALVSWPFKRNKQNHEEKTEVRVVIEGNAGMGTQRRDEIFSNKHRTFLPRYTREMMISPKVVLEVE